MFLLEDYNNDLYDGITADPTCGYEIIMEAEDAINDVSMAMIKLEHNAIMSEDAGLLVEGAKEFGAKVKDALKRAWEKFKVYLEKIYVGWTSLQAKFSSAFLSKNKVDEMIENVGTGTIEVTIKPNKIKKVVTEINKIGGYLKKLAASMDLGLVQDIGSAIDEMNKDVNEALETDGGKYTLTKSDLSNGLTFIKNRKDLVKMIKTFSSDGNKLFREAIKEADKGEGKNECRQIFTAFQRLSNRAIILTNKTTKLSVTILRAALKSNKKAQKDENKSESVLDAYMF